MNKILHGDCIELMQTLEDNSIDAIVDDPPYGLGFMGETWDTFKPKQFQEFIYKVSEQKIRILKPGGYNLSFSGTRTYHRMVCGIEDAGFKIKDMLMWCYGSGFPKSLDISKAIDKYYGKEREVIGLKKDFALDGCIRDPSKHHPENQELHIKTNWDSKVTISNSEEAKKWDGWGTGLKPAFEPIVVAQKPYENTYAENVLKYGVGGLNIDGCRINYTPEKETDNRIYDQEKNVTRGQNKEAIIGFTTGAFEGQKMYKQGRFPSNLILTHHPECRLIGSKEVGNGKRKYNQEIHRQELETLELSTFTADNSGFKANKGKGLGNYGIETIDAYDCHPDCPIRLLDEQSGETVSKSNFMKTDKGGNDFTLKFAHKQDEFRGHNDKGGASRFFKTFNGQSRFIYNGKAHKSERNAGLLELESKRDTMFIESDNTLRLGGASLKGKSIMIQPKKNNISTLKPINVMRYLVRLVCPPNGTVLDPFAGSGTTGIACILEGFNYILIEKRKRFAEVIIPKRLEFWKDPSNWSTLKDHNILPKIKTIKRKKQNYELERWL